MCSQTLKARPRIEPLEDRTLMSTCHVTRLSDSGVGKGFRGDLRYCINKVNAEPGPDAIDFTVTGTINLTHALPFVRSDITFAGPGADVLTVRRSTEGIYRILTINKHATVEILGLTLANGFLNSDYSGDQGGGIWNAGNLTLQETVVTGNRVEGFLSNGALGGGIYNSGTLNLVASRVEGNTVGSTSTVWEGAAAGGGIFNSGNLTAIDSTIAHNTAFEGAGATDEGDAYGGGISNTGTVSLDRCTVSFNVAVSHWWAAFGGGISNSRTLDIHNSTIAGNRAVAPFGVYGGALYSGGSQAFVTIGHSTIADNLAFDTWVDPPYPLAGMWWQGAMHIRNTIVANNTGPVISGVLTSSGYNLFSDSHGGSGYYATDLLNVDPVLGPLQDNGGPTFTHELLPGSPAIDAGDNTDAPEWDQRGPGFPRIVNGTIDIGAFEVQASPIPDTSSPHPSIASLVSSLVYEASRGAVLGPPLTAGLATFTATATPFTGFLDVRLEPPDANGSSQTARSSVNGANQNDTDWSTRPQRRAYSRPAESPVNEARPDPTADLDAIT